MKKLDNLRSGWDQANAKAAAEKRNKNKAPPVPVIAELSNELVVDREEAPDVTAGLFDDSDSSDEEEEQVVEVKKNADNEIKEIAVNTTHQDLFGDSSDEESDEELKPSSGTKRGVDDNEEQPPTKKNRKRDD